MQSGDFAKKSFLSPQNPIDKAHRATYNLLCSARVTILFVCGFYRLVSRGVIRLELNLRQIMDRPGEGENFAGAIDLSWIKRHGQSLFPESLAVEGRAENRAGVVSLRYQICGVLQYDCERCLMQVRRDITRQYEHTVVRELQDESLDDVFLVAPEGIIDLDEVAAGNLQLELPQVLLCKPDCKGLCSVCGTNLNEKNCGCHRNGGDPRMAILKQLLQEDE